MYEAAPSSMDHALQISLGSVPLDASTSNAQEGPIYTQHKEFALLNFSFVSREEAQQLPVQAPVYENALLHKIQADLREGIARLKLEIAILEAGSVVGSEVGAFDARVRQICTSPDTPALHKPPWQAAVDETERGDGIPVQVLESSDICHGPVTCRTLGRWPSLHEQVEHAAIFVVLSSGAGGETGANTATGAKEIN